MPGNLDAPPYPMIRPASSEPAGSDLFPADFWSQPSRCALKSRGVRPVCFRKAVLNVDFELNPTSIAISNTVRSPALRNNRLAR